MKRLLAKLLLGAVLLSLIGAAAASGAQTRALHYRGSSFAVPAAWPVYRLAQDPNRCMRLDRRAVYLGEPSPEQRCPAHAVGRNRAILIEPTTAGARRVAASTPAPAPPGHPPLSRAQSSASYFTGLGFDACSAPPVTTMAAWLSSPYRVIGVYIGGTNRGCSQPNLTSDWVASQIAAGWHLIPTYVGLQAPSNSCGCAAIKLSQAAAQGSEAADDAVTQAALLGIGAGNPIYFDMEGYSQTSTNTSAVLSFLAAWTDRLHAHGYLSGVYGSVTSTIDDLVGQYGLGYSEPDDIWIAHWDGQQTTSDAYVPATYWANHQRIRQYRGGHNERYGGVSLNIDNDYIDGAVVGTASAPVLRVHCRNIIFSHRPRTGVFKLRAFNLPACGRARQVAMKTKSVRFGAAGETRAYRKAQFSCQGTEVGRSRVLYECRSADAKIRFVRRGLT
jgi:Domain of unknown function (DUF1906)